MQLTLEGKSLIQHRIDVSVDRLKYNEPEQGYYGAFSGGKDSQTIYRLSVLAGVRVDWHYNQTGIDPPELVDFIRKHYPKVQRHTQHPSIWQLVEKRGLPRRQGRWCCELLKEKGGAGRIVLTGVRWEESTRRRNRRMLEVCRKDETKHYLNPIIDWSSDDVWGFLELNELPHCQLYDEGFERIGCVLCPMHNKEQTIRDMTRWPKLASAWERAAVRYWERQTDGGKKFPDGVSFFKWWLTRSSHSNDAQCVMFE